MQCFATDGKTVSVFPSAVPGAPVIYLNTFADEGQKVFAATQAAACPAFTLVAVHELDWNHDMTPWESPPVFKNTPPCTGGAGDYLRLLTEEIAPTVEKALSQAPRWRGIAGYSLAGLFAMYALCQTDMFSRAGSISGSLWYLGMKEYLFSHIPSSLPDCIYFSLGERESKTRNPVLQCVRRNTEEIQTFYQNKGIDTVFQLNPGNHYDHATERTAAGIVWMLNQ